MSVTQQLESLSCTSVIKEIEPICLSEIKACHSVVISVTSMQATPIISDGYNKNAKHARKYFANDFSTTKISCAYNYTRVSKKYLKSK